jgi:hypothetical protein
MPQISAGGERPFVLEECQRLSESMIWTKVKLFFESHGHVAFSSGSVPNFVTTNAFIARAYARVMMAFIEDCVAAGQIDPSEPVYLIELGAGSGRLGYRAFLELRALVEKKLQGLKLKLILTDLGKANRKFWLGHFRLKPLIEEGLVDVARFNIETDRELQLEASGETLAAGAFRNPVLLMANYLFDSIPIDVFWVDADGKLNDSLVTIRSSVAEPKWKEHNVWRNMAFEFHRKPVEGPRYENPLWNAILEHCASLVRDGVVVFPVSGFRCLENFGELCGNRYFLMTSDKGYHHPEFAPRKEMLFSMDGSLSSDVNYHAFETFFQAAGGQSFVTSYVSRSLDTCAFSRVEDIDLPCTAEAFADAVEAFAPYDFLRISLSKQPDDPITVPEYLAFLRLSNYDSHMASRHADAVITKIPDLASELRHQLLLAVDKVWAGYLPLGEPEDVPLALGRIMIALAYWEPAVELLIASVGIYGETESNTYHLALCCLQLGDLERAEEMVAKAIAFNPGEAAYQELQKAIAARTA